MNNPTNPSKSLISSNPDPTLAEINSVPKKSEEDINPREKGIKEPEDALGSRENKTKDRQTEPDRRESQIKEMEPIAKVKPEQLANDDQTLESKRAQIAKELRKLEQQRIMAEAGFAQENAKALGALKMLRDQLLEQINKLSQRLLKEETEGLESVRKKIHDLEASLRDAMEERLTEAENSQRSRSNREIAQANGRLDERQKSIEVRENEVAESEGETSAREKRCQEWESELRQRNDSLSSDIERRAQTRIADLESQLKAFENREQALLEESAQLREEVRSYRELEARFGTEYPKRTAELLKKAQRENETLRSELAKAPSPDTTSRLEKAEETLQELVANLSNANKELALLRVYESRHKAHIAERDAWALEKPVLERTRDMMVQKFEELKRQVEEENAKLQAKRGEQTLEKRAASLRAPFFPVRERQETIEETVWLKRIEDGVKQCGVEFPKRLLYAFHTSLKCSEITQMTVLAGVSGTGKSLLPKLYARAGGILFHMVSVQPDWDSPQSLFGHYNSLEGQFSATDFVRAFYQSQQPLNGEFPGTNDVLTMFLLDEMNLAHVELYLSDILSKLEDRRGEMSLPSVGIDLGAGCERYPITIGRNVLWAGTMNEDETTKALSDKVIDRSAALVFPRPNELKSAKLENMPADSIPLLGKETWKGWCKSKPVKKESLENYRKLLQDINKILNPAGRAIGHRVWQGVEAYLQRHPDVASAGEDDKSLATALDNAFEDQLAMRVFSKFRGLETTGDVRKKCLDPIKDMLSKGPGKGLLKDFEMSCNSPTGVFRWSSAEFMVQEES